MCIISIENTYEQWETGNGHTIRSTHMQINDAANDKGIYIHRTRTIQYLSRMFSSCFLPLHSLQIEYGYLIIHHCAFVSFRCF